MDVEDDTAVYLNYLNDPNTTNSYLLSNNVELSDALPFSEIGTTDWPSESFPVLLNASLIAECNASNAENSELFNGGETLVQTIGIQTDSANGTKELLNTLIPVENDALISEDITVVSPEVIEQIEEDPESIQSVPTTTYVNYSPIVKENADGNREFYLTEKDINNDASIIQLFNTDGSVITIDKSILSTLNCPKKNGQTVKQNPRDYTPHYTPVIANKCKICDELFENEKDVKRHLDQKHAELFHQELLENGKPLFNTLADNGKKYTIFLCSICRLAFSEKELLKEHMINNHQLCTVDTGEQNSVQSSKGDEKKSVKVLANILIKEQEKARMKYLCRIKNCKVRFPNSEILKKHEDCHVGENRRQFKCTECDQKFSIWRICSNHYWKVHKIDFGLYSCPICDKYKHNSSNKVMEHMAVHNEERPFLCSECGKGYKTMVQLRNHEILHKKSDDVPKWSAMRRCDICERYFSSAKCLKIHIQSVHENFKPFVCNICGHKTTRKAMLELHIRQHTGQKPHECSYCSYRTGDPNCLRRHVMKHVGLRKYKCQYCTYTSIQSNSLKSHMMRRHPGKEGTYNCNYCSYSSINMSYYISHLKTHEIAAKSNGTSAQDASKSEGTNNSKRMDIEDEETQPLFSIDNTIEETVIDTGGITIPAGLDLVSKQ